MALLVQNLEAIFYRNSKFGSSNNFLRLEYYFDCYNPKPHRKMAKGMNSQKSAKKAPTKTPKEKKEEKREKKKGGYE